MRTPLLALLATLALLLGACTRTQSDPGSAGGGSQGGSNQGEAEEKGLPSADFQLGDIRVVDSQDRPEAASKADGENSKVVALVNAYYNAAFVDPTQFPDPSHNALKNVFTDEAKGAVDPRINQLSLGDIADKIEEVKPQTQKIERLTYYFDSDINSPLGIVSINFEATATPKDEDAPPVKVHHTGTWLLQKVGDDYRIQAFDANIDLSSQ